MSDSFWPHRLQQTRLPCPLPFPTACSNSCQLSRWWHPTISSSVILLLLHSVFTSIRVFYNESALFIRLPKGWSFSFSISPFMNIQGRFPLGLTIVWSPCCLRGSQEFSPAPQLKIINSSAFSLLYDPVLTFICDYWKNHSSDYTDLSWQNDASAF